MILHVLLGMLAGWSQRHQQRFIAYLMKSAQEKRP
jgi:hypothetical protein